MEQYEKPNMDVIVLADDVISTSGCNYECGSPGTGTIELPCQPGDY